MENFEDLVDEIKNKQKQSGVAEIHLGNVNALFIDPSSSCLGYSIVNFDITSKRAQAKITKAGVLWFNNDWSHGEKYSYVFNAILNYFDIVECIDLIVYEQYSVSTDKGSGIMVVPELIGCVKLAGQENGIKVLNILPQSWRAAIGLKPNVVTKDGKNKRDYKTPCVSMMKSLIKNYPDQCISNITGKTRATPHDLADSLGVATGWLNKNGFTNISYSSCVFNGHIGFLTDKGAM